MNNSEASLPHSELRDKAWSRIDTTKTEDMVPASELRRWLVNYCDLFEQLETVRELNRRAELRCADAFMEARGLKEQLEAAQRVVDAARTVSEIEATGTLPDFQPLADALAALNPASRSNDE